MSTRLPHFHALVACGALTPAGNFLEVPEFNLDWLRAAWQGDVFAPYLAEDKIGAGSRREHAQFERTTASARINGIVRSGEGIRSCPPQPKTSQPPCVGFVVMHFQVIVDNEGFFRSASSLGGNWAAGWSPNDVPRDSSGVKGIEKALNRSCVV